MKLRNIFTTAIVFALLLSVGVNFWQYYNPRTIKGETVYLESENLPTTAITTLSGGNQSATSETKKDYGREKASAKELVSIVKGIPDLENEKQITQLTAVKASLELALTEKDLVLNDKEKQLKEWKDKFNSVKVDNSTNKVDVNSEVSPKIANTEKRERWFAPKIPYTTITSENPSIKFYGVESYTFKNPKQKNFLELNINAQGVYIDRSIFPNANAEIIFNPDGFFRPFIGYGYLYDYNSGKMIKFGNAGFKINLVKL